MKKLEKIFLWLPRVLTILFIIFISIFSLDIFDSQLGFWGTIVGLLVHNIPTFILIIIAVVCWRRYLTGAITFVLLAALYLFGFGRPMMTKFPLTLIAVLISICYLYSYLRNKYSPR